MQFASTLQEVLVKLQICYTWCIITFGIWQSKILFTSSMRTEGGELYRGHKSVTNHMLCACRSPQIHFLVCPLKWISGRGSGQERLPEGFWKVQQFMWQNATSAHIGEMSNSSPYSIALWFVLCLSCRITGHLNSLQNRFSSTWSPFLQLQIYLVCLSPLKNKWEGTRRKMLLSPGKTPEDILSLISRNGAKKSLPATYAQKKVWFCFFK